MTDNAIYSQPNAWISPCLETRENAAKNGFGTYAIEFIQKDELLALWGGTIVMHEQLQHIPERLRQLSIQVTDAHYLVSTIVGSADYINHSCDPTAGLWGQIGLVAMRDILPGEEICFDYAMSDSSDYDEFECGCGARNCRQHITGKDWQNPDLWERYDGYFSPYLQNKIDKMKEQIVESNTRTA